MMGIDISFVVMYGIKFDLKDWSKEQKDMLYKLSTKYIRSMDIDGTEWVVGYPELVTESFRWDIPCGQTVIDINDRAKFDEWKNEVMQALAQYDLSHRIHSEFVQWVDDNEWKIISYVETS